MEPIRLEYVKLKRSLEAAEDRYLALTRHEQQGIDDTQIMIDNQVLSDKVEERVRIDILLHVKSENCD